MEYNGIETHSDGSWNKDELKPIVVLFMIRAIPDDVCKHTKGKSLTVKKASRWEKFMQVAKQHLGLSLCRIHLV